VAAWLRLLNLWTIGHGTVELDAFLTFLLDANLSAQVDVRRFPGSRRHPQFAAASLERALARAGIAYSHAAALGGRRRPCADSSNIGLRNEAFRGYADWMRGDAFRSALAKLLSLAAQQRTVVMCAETPWWKCHRRLIADAAVLLHGATVMHLISGKASPHVLTSGVVTVGDRLLYLRSPVAEKPPPFDARERV
jgi:uncharacterized protein (DUF488 family)